MSLEGGTVSVSADGNTTQSVLSFTPTPADHGLILTCKASNQRIPFSEQQHTWMLRVLYPPKVTLTLGHGLDPSDIREGADVYFDCHIVANPWVSIAELNLVELCMLLVLPFSIYKIEQSSKIFQAVPENGSNGNVAHPHSEK